MGRDTLEQEARELWEEAEIRILSSPWTLPTKFEDCKDYFIKKVLDKRKKS